MKIQRGLAPLLVAASLLSGSSFAQSAACPYGRDPAGNCLPPPPPASTPQRIQVRVKLAVHEEGSSEEPDSVALIREGTKATVTLKQRQDGVFTALVRIPPGKYTLEVKKSGYFTDSQAVTVPAGGLLDKTVVLAKYPSLVVSATDVDTRKALDGIFSVEGEQEKAALGSTHFITNRESECLKKKCRVTIDAPGYETGRTIEVDQKPNGSYGFSMELHQQGTLKFYPEFSELSKLEVLDERKKLVATVRVFRSTRPRIEVSYANGGPSNTPLKSDSMADVRLDAGTYSLRVATLDGTHAMPATTKDVWVEWNKNVATSLSIVERADPRTVTDAEFKRLERACESARKPASAAARAKPLSSDHQGSAMRESKQTEALAQNAGSDPALPDYSSFKARSSCRRYALALHARDGDQQAIDLSRKLCEAGQGASCEDAGWLLRYSQEPALRAATEKLESAPEVAKLYREGCEKGSCSRLFASPEKDRQRDPAADLTLEPQQGQGEGHDHPFGGDDDDDDDEAITLGVDVQWGAPVADQPSFGLVRPVTFLFADNPWGLVYRPLLFGGGSADFTTTTLNDAGQIEVKPARDGFGLVGFPGLSGLGIQFGAPATGFSVEVDVQLAWVIAEDTMFTASPGASVGWRLKPFTFQAGIRYQQLPTDFGTIIGSDEDVAIAKTKWFLIPSLTILIAADLL